jgi:hypothetical protein
MVAGRPWQAPELYCCHNYARLATANQPLPLSIGVGSGRMSASLVSSRRVQNATTVYPLGTVRQMWECSLASVLRQHQCITTSRSQVK